MFKLSTRLFILTFTFIIILPSCENRNPDSSIPQASVSDTDEPAEPETQAAEPETQTAEPETQTAEPETQAAEPETQPVEPETQPVEPETQVAEPETQAVEPETQVAEPETQVAEPETQAAEPETQTAEPEAQPAETGKAVDPSTQKINYACNCDPDTIYKNDSINRIYAQNSYTVEEAVQEVAQACKDQKPGEQTIKLFFCRCYEENKPYSYKKCGPIKYEF